MRIDLHTHSDVSDGTGSPAELTAAAASLPQGLTLLPGVQLSCRWHGGSRPTGLHLLGYLFDPGHPELSAELRRIRHTRARRAERMVGLLRAGGIDVTWQEVQGYAGGGWSGGRISPRR